MTTQRAIRAIVEIVRENQENGELEGVLNRDRIAALNHLVRLAEAAEKSKSRDSMDNNLEL